MKPNGDIGTETLEPVQKPLNPWFIRLSKDALNRNLPVFISELMDQVIVLPVLGGCPTWSSLCGLWESVLYSHYWAGRQADSHVLRQPGRADICVHAELERGDNSPHYIVLV